MYVSYQRTYKRPCHGCLAISEPIITKHSTYVAYVLYSTTDHLKGLFPDNFYVCMYAVAHVIFYLATYSRIMYFTHVYIYGLIPRIFLSLLCECYMHMTCVSHECDTSVPFKLLVICTVLY